MTAASHQAHAIQDHPCLTGDEGHVGGARLVRIDRHHLTRAHIQTRAVVQRQQPLVARCCGKALAAKGFNQVPPLNNRELFRRDRHMCAYCGSEHGYFRLTRDHITPLSRGGRDTWMNVVTACRQCNGHKRNRLPQECGMELLYAPYVPNKAEYLILTNRRILADQMEFLKQHVASHSRLALAPA